jgi:hypothetical protein
MPTWSRAILRTVGVLNTVFAIAGAFWLVSSARWGLFRLEPRPDIPYFKTVFAVMTAINAVFIVLFVVAAVQLLRLRRSGVTLHAVSSALLIAYGLVNGKLWLAGHGIGISIAAATGVGNMGIALFVFGFYFHNLYPIASSLALFFARWKMTATIEGGSTIAAV